MYWLIHRVFWQGLKNEKSVLFPAQGGYPQKNNLNTFSPGKIHEPDGDAYLCSNICQALLITPAGGPMELALSITGHYEPRAQDRNVTSVIAALPSPWYKGVFFLLPCRCAQLVFAFCVRPEKVLEPKGPEPWHRLAWVQVLALPFICCLTLSEYLYFSKPELLLL